MKRISATLLAVFAILVAFGSCDESEPAAPSPTKQKRDFGPLPATAGGFPVTGGAAPGYVDDKACQECHKPQFESYGSVGMSHAFYAPDADRVIETADLDKEFVHEKSGSHYVMSFRDDRYVLRRFCVDSKGRRFAEVEQEVAWVMGSGNLVRSYLMQNDAGELFQLPVSWYRGLGYRMSPGFDQVDHPRFERVIERGCLFCHNSYPEMRKGEDLPHQSHRFPTSLPHGLGCQRCHGPGAHHVAIAEDENASEESVKASIANPATQSPRQQEDLCLSCHLQPESVRSRMMPRAFDRGAFSFEPGDDLAAFIKFLDHGSAEQRAERLEINHHGYRLRQSECYVQSAGKLTCVTCHDPHKKVPVEERSAHYRKVCTKCHSVGDCKTDDQTHRAAPHGSDCVKCHMMRARPSDVIHVLVTDHRIHRHPLPESATAPREEHHQKPQPLTIVPYFPDRFPRTDPQWPLFRGFGEAYFPTSESAKEWREAFERTKPHPVSAYVVIGRGLLEVGDVDGATAILREAIEKFPTDAPARWSLGEALLMHSTRTNNPSGGVHLPAAIATLEEAARLDGKDPGILGALGEAYRRTGAFEKARAAYERALALRPNSAATWAAYGHVLWKTDKLEDAAAAFDTSIRWNPRSSYAHGALAAVRRQQGRFEDQIRVLEHGATLLTDIKLDLIAEKFLTRVKSTLDPKGGLALATDIAKAEPKNPRALLHFALATVFEGKGRAGLAAIRAARTAGADAASCTALSILYWTLQRQDVRVEQLLEVLAREERTPTQERLRSRLLAHLRGLKIR